MIGAALGAGIGLMTGGLTRGALAYVKDASDKLFYSVWAGGMMVRAGVLAAAFFVLLRHPDWPIVPTILALLLAQFATQLIPIRSQRAHGI
jgi:hypothetical protein